MGSLQQIYDSTPQDPFPLDSTELDFLNTFESMVDDDTPLLQRGNLSEEDMTPVSYVTSLPTPKCENEQLEDNCVIVNIKYGIRPHPIHRPAHVACSMADEKCVMECPGAPMINDCSTFNDGSGVGDFDFLELDDHDEVYAGDAHDEGTAFSMAALEALPCTTKMDLVQNWRSTLDNTPDYLTAGPDGYSHEAGMGNKRTRSIALSDDLEERRPHPPPECTLGLSNMHPSRHNPPD
ncbi:hypothetical protein BDZ89DRAFT_236856 [Hymenopellis radicata]|nr:hypothetical protein BDZ89DRAFT_236856 [Hymenopellis radicata]